MHPAKKADDVKAREELKNSYRIHGIFVAFEDFFVAAKALEYRSPAKKKLNKGREFSYMAIPQISLNDLDTQ